MDTDSAFFVNNPKRIHSYLSHLLKKKCLLSAHFGDNNDSFITTIVDIDPKKNLLILDYGPKEYLNKLLLKSEHKEFRTELDGIKVAFSADKIAKTRIDGHAVFTMPIPDAIFWMQRRKFYRLKVPLAHNSYCAIGFTNEEDNSEKIIRFKLMDISISGFAIINEQLKLSKDLIPTAEFENCTLHLHDGEEENVSFVIKNKFNLNPDKPDKGQRIGCEFTEITPLFESHIQRYMQNIERELRTVL
ncbi:flagellar brake protein [Methylomarinum vadi]|uniref:flagellar brake protein n=1 Tax=Methylomarinum vadi TaxID=438855 RepID=UPI0004DF6085|nr:flagellar brake protein [Methylomarinum vadi]